MGCWIKEGVRTQVNERNGGRSQQGDEKGGGGIRRNKRGIFVAVKRGKDPDFSAPPTSAHASTCTFAFCAPHPLRED